MFWICFENFYDIMNNPDEFVSNISIYNSIENVSQ